MYKRQLLNNPDFLIIDEPTTGLDPEERIRIRNLLVDFSKDRTVLLDVYKRQDKDQPVCGSSGQNNLPVQERLPDCKI